MNFSEHQFKGLLF